MRAGGAPWKTEILIFKNLNYKANAVSVPVAPMTLVALVLTSLAASLALISLGGGLYETRVLDPAWPGRIDLIQPQHGGVSRRRFWIPMHLAFEFSLIAALILAWPQRPVRLCLLLALASHAAMRIWSAFSFIPQALAFEQARPGPATEAAARRWTRRSRLRLLLDLLTCGAALAAFALMARLS